MSVINKMLRDLDSRQHVATAPVRTPQAPIDIARGTQVVADNARVVRRSRPLGPASMLLALLMTISALACWWYLDQAKVLVEVHSQERGAFTAVATPSVAVEAVPQLLPSLAQPRAEPKIEANMPALAPVAQATSASALPVAARPPALKPDSASSNASPNLERTKSPVLSIQSSSPQATSGVAIPSVSDRAALGGGNDFVSGSTAPLLASSPAISRVLPGLEALASAQKLWTSGNNDAAIDVLEEALSHAERSSSGGSQPVKNGVLVPVARELARMKLSEGRVREVLDMLTRLEISLSDVADIWALRGNAAQRLGRHQESVSAYLRALALRPDEARWKLGAAISLAAQGQITAAADLAQEAHLVGAASPEVILYLRQLGVFLRER